MAHSCKKCEARHRSPLECADCLSRRETAEHSALKELRTASELIVSLREEKHALKGALQSALSKNDELYDKVLTSNHSLKEEVRRRKAAEEELKKARSEIAHFDKKLTEAKILIESKEQELQRMERMVEISSKEGQLTNLEATNRSLKNEIREMRSELESRFQFSERTQHKISKYCCFISNKLNEVPDFLALFKGRFKNPEDFRGIEDEEGVLKILQFLADLLMYEAQKPRSRLKDYYSDEEVEVYQEEPTSWQYKSINKSIQTQSEKATNTYETAPVTPYAMLSQASSRGEMKKTPSLGRDSSFTYLYKQPYETPKAYKEPSFKETSYNTGLSDTSGLIEVLSFQNEKLNRLNQQIAETMASSRTLLNTSRALDSRARSAARVFKHEEVVHDDESLPTERRMTKALSERDLGIPMIIETKAISGMQAPENLKSPTAQKSPYEKSTKLPNPFASPKNEIKPAPSEEELPGKTEFLQSPKSTSTVRMRSPNSGRSIIKPGAKKVPPIKEKILKTMPVLHKNDGWGSVKEFFGRSDDDEKRQEDTDRTMVSK
mmetsp:Transcript_968/g.2356  ORF Transcript_968/g.2356 Transcript_968/m.2356 type:complete len:550 (-) Transcript_968:3174-4823(-)